MPRLKVFLLSFSSYIFDKLYIGIIKNYGQMSKYINIILITNFILFYHDLAHAQCSSATYEKMKKDYTIFKHQVDTEYRLGKIAKSTFDKFSANFNMAEKSYLKEYNNALQAQSIDEIQCDSLSNLFFELINGLKDTFSHEIPQSAEPLPAMPIEREPVPSAPQETEAVPSYSNPLVPLEKEPTQPTPLEKEPITATPKETEPTHSVGKP